MAGARSKSSVKANNLGVNKRQSKSSRKAAKDPNKPKRPASAFFVFMEDFRQQFKRENPNNKSVSAVGKAGGAQWKAMSDAEKAPFAAKAEKRKAEYEKSMEAYNRRLADGPKDDEDTSEVNDGKDEDDEEEEDEDDE